MAETNPYDEFDSLSGAAMPGIDDAPSDDGKRDEELTALRKQADDQRALYLRALAGNSATRRKDTVSSSNYFSLVFGLLVARRAWTRN